ncbi:MAG: [LysW]-lysine hydrolase [Thermoplasmatota archaeon]
MPSPEPAPNASARLPRDAPGVSEDARDARLLHDLVSIPSPTGSTAKASEFLVDCMRRRGFDEAFVDEVGNAVGIAGKGPREILLVGHIDTVPGFPPVHLDGNVLWGRGAVDAKGPLAAFACAAQAFVGREDVRIVVVGCCDEEAESVGAQHLISRYRPEALVIGEPSGTDGVTIGYKGIVKIRYSLEEDLAHTGAPFPSVPDRAIAFWNAVTGYLAPLHGTSLFDTPTAKLVSIQTAVTQAGRHQVHLSGSVRIPPGFDAEAFRSFLAARAAGGELDVPETSPAHLASKNTLVARAFVDAVRTCGRIPRYVKKTGTSDMNLLAPAWQVPCVAYGPGDATLDHTPQERVDLAEFADAVQILKAALQRIAAPDA